MHLAPVWLTGDLQDADFAPAIAWLREVAACVEVSANSLPAALADFPMAIVLFQSRPGAISQAFVESLHRRAPLARLIVVVGLWCEGELRSGRPSQGITRILWHQWPARLPNELGLGSGEAARPGYLPRTLTPVDLLLRTHPRFASAHRHRGVAAVCSASRPSFEALADACAVAGLELHWQQPEDLSQMEAADLVVLDGREWLSSWPQSVSPARLTLWLVDWPRPDDLALAQQYGIHRVLARPFLLVDFVATIDEILPRPRILEETNSAA